MTVLTKTAANVFAPTTAGGVPRGADMGEALVWGTEIEYLANLAYTSSLVYSTRSALFANLAPAANTPALVIGDPTPGHDGLYGKVGGTGTGSWTRIGDVPGYNVVRFFNVGAGTANAIVATAGGTVSAVAGAQIYTLNILADNTGNVTLNGKALLTSSGSQIAAGGLVAGMNLAFLDDGTSYRLLTDQASAAIVAAAEAAADRAEAAAAAAAATVPALEFASIAGLRAFNATTLATVAYVTGWHAGTRRGGGKFVLVASDTTSVDDDGTIIVDAALRRWYRVVRDNILTASQFGAQPAVNATPALTAMFAACVAFGLAGGMDPKDVFPIDTTVTVPDGVDFYARGGKLTTSNLIQMVQLLGNNKVWRLHLTGIGTSGNTVASTGNRGIRVIGDFNGAGVAPNIVPNIDIRYCDIREIRGEGINLTNVVGFEVHDNRIHDVGYGGITCIGAQSGRITRNHVSLVGPGGPSSCYNIAVTRSAGGDHLNDLVRAPRAKDILVSGNTCEDNLFWEALDTHAGENIVFSNNIVRRCCLGIVMTHDNANACINCEAIGNHITGRYLLNGTSDDAAVSGHGIVVVGNLSTGALSTGCKVQDNFIQGFGNSNSAIGAGIYAYSTYGLTITGNTIKNCYNNGVNLFTTNTRFVLTDNTIIDIGSNAFPSRGVWISSTGCVGIIGNLTITRQVGWGTGTLASDGIEIFNSATNIITWNGDNNIQASTVPKRYTIGAAVIHKGYPRTVTIEVSTGTISTAASVHDFSPSFPEAWNSLRAVDATLRSYIAGNSRAYAACQSALPLADTAGVAIRVATMGGGNFAATTAATIEITGRGF